MCTAPTTISRKRRVEHLQEGRGRRMVAVCDWSRRSAVSAARSDARPASLAEQRPAPRRTDQRLGASLVEVAHEADAGIWPPGPLQRRERLRASRDRSPFDEDLDLAAAGEADVPGLLVGDAEFEQPRRAPSMQASASWTTAPSMQPPETEPAPWRRSRRRPAAARPGRGEEPQVVTTVATATPCGRPPPLADLIQQALIAWLMVYLLSREVRHPLAQALGPARARAARARRSARRRLSRLCAGRNSSTWRQHRLVALRFGRVGARTARAG